MTFQFKIELQNILDPPVWRTVLVPDNFTFYQFHLVIQSAFGWENCHLFQFSPKGYNSEPIISIVSTEWDEEVMNSEEIMLSEIFTKPKQKFFYIYDFGDDWEHQITLEKIISDTLKTADCIDGKGTCPPEDCGGPWGYGELKTILANPKHKEHAGMKEWLGLKKTQAWKADAFNLKKLPPLFVKFR